MLLAVLFITLRPGPASGFAPAAAQAVAFGLAKALPAAAGSSSWSEVAAASVADALAAEEGELESAAVRHRYDATRIRELTTREPADEVTGLAPFAFAEAVAALERAFNLLDAGSRVTALVRVAIHATDLADPFLMTVPSTSEVEGARAAFADLIELGSVETEAGVRTGEPLTAAVRLARESAALRPAVEEAAGRGDLEALETIRRQRLSAALNLASTFAGAAWERSERSAPRRPEVEAWIHPNPVREGAFIHFQMDTPGMARLEIYDLSGRLLVQRSLGTLARGPQSVALAGLELNLPAGLYLARLDTPAGPRTARLIRVSR